MNPIKPRIRIGATALLIWLALFTPAAPARADAPVIGEPASSSAPAYQPAYQPAFTGCARVNVPVQNAAYEQQVLDLVNQERDNADVAPLKRNTDLDYAARFHAKDMQDEDYVAHESYDGATLVCDWSERVSNFYTGWNWLGENIAAGQSTPAEVMAGWMGSPGHKANILNSSYREIGVGYYYGSKGYDSYWVQDFGARGGVYPLIINQDAAQTNTPYVSLYIYAPNTPGVEMRLRNDGAAWGAWQPYQAELEWTLTHATGTRTVSVELRSGTSTYASSDTIEAVGLGPLLGNLPDGVNFIYDQSTAQLIPGPITLQPLNIGSDDPLTWQVSAADSWINLQNGSGSAPTSTFWFAPAGAVLQSPGTHTTTLTVTVTSPSGVPGSPKAIQVQLHVVNALDHFLFLSSIQR